MVVKEPVHQVISVEIYLSSRQPVFCTGIVHDLERQVLVLKGFVKFRAVCKKYIIVRHAMNHQ